MGWAAFVRNAGAAGLPVLREGWKPVRVETPVPRWLDAQRDSPALRSRETPGPTSLSPHHDPHGKHNQHPQQRCQP